MPSCLQSIDNTFGLPVAGIDCLPVHLQSSIDMREYMNKSPTLKTLATKLSWKTSMNTNTKIEYKQPNKHMKQPQK